MCQLLSGSRSGNSRTFARLGCAVAASSIAIVVNTALLSGADYFHFVTARGGLLSLILQVARRYATVSSIYHTYGFQQAFHGAVGIAMGIAYAFLFVRLRGSAWRRGAMYGALVWLANACIVQPMIHQGFAGYRVISVGGMLYFACAHMMFFLLCAVLFEWFYFGISTRDGTPDLAGWGYLLLRYRTPQASFRSPGRQVSVRTCMHWRFRKKIQAVEYLPEREVHPYEYRTDSRILLKTGSRGVEVKSGAHKVRSLEYRETA